MATRPRDEAGYMRFLYYLDETGLDAEVRAVCLRHHVTARDVYMDTKGPSTHAARLEIWYWLTETIKKSTGEVGRIFDRDGSSICHALRKLRETAEAMSIELTAIGPLGAADAARATALKAAEGRVRAGKLVGVLGRRGK
jgi:imidazole glycerol phosphate synthase subunit HisF